jgi:hypothetical protein
MDVPELDGWVSATEFANWRGVSKQAIHKMITSGKITTARRAGRGLVISRREAVALAAAGKPGLLIPLELPGGDVAQVACGQVPGLIFWCWDTAGSQASFTTEARRQGADGAADWAAGRQYIPQNPPAQRGVTSPRKAEIADYLQAALLQA